MKNNSGLLLGIIILIIGVTGIMYTSSTQHPMVDMMRAMSNIQFPPGLASSELPEAGSNEVSLLKKYCTQCHALPGPGMHTGDEWPLVIGRMNQYMQTMHAFHIHRPSFNEIQLMQSYLQKHAQIAMDKSKYPELDSPAGIAFMQTCSRCHSTPSPTQHTPEEWPMVVQRMKENMRIMGKNVPDEQTTMLVTEFLQRHAVK